ncbi:hypothetical protein [Rhizobium leguminosarum]|uniref:hypothetical protein n=1 Tax=Rhizobium leguminosarum TaxID=384 RepID=UPI00103B47D5|nr:hypothetical protein [Rhizobium leguminosarum]MBY5367841.1 hypothetical protein [Rhizobium leguminosarum]TBY21448.1 hypothetical protein E0H30_14585 [Rhizobium leguminosarum bv. viciae]TBY31050.1 hypothetical protein E0H37_09360 [Rhizobium leguminosarum bv. viciae]
MSEESDAPLSARIMARLVQEAKDNGSDRRLGTLARLKEACDDIASGRALELARKEGWSTTYFHPHRRLVALSVHEYRKLKQSLSPRTEPPGPTKDTIAHDEGLSDYLRARDGERNGARPPARKGTRARRVDEILLEKLDLNDQAAVRTELEDGRLARLRYNTLAAFFHKLSGVDLRDRENFSFEDVAAEIRGQISGDDRHALSSLVARLHDDRVLAGMGLQYEAHSGRIMTDLGDLVLITASEMRVLVRLSGLNPDSLKPIN